MRMSTPLTSICIYASGVTTRASSNARANPRYVQRRHAMSNPYQWSQRLRATSGFLYAVMLM